MCAGRPRSPVSDAERRIRRHVEREHRNVVDGIDACAAAVERSLSDDRRRDGAAIRAALRAELERAGLRQRLSTVLDASLRATSFELPAELVPAPPYVVVTSRGPMLRATLDSGRIVIRFDVFEVDRDGGYRGLDGVEVRAALRRAGGG